jgi:hypothetical protein
MVDVARGVPLIDVLAPPGSAGAASDIQTRMELAGGAGWRIQADDGTMEHSMLPSQPLRGGLDRIWATRHSPMYPGESMQESVALGMELAISLQAPLAAVGVYGVVGWGLVLFEEPRWLYGLTLLEWLYNPRLSSAGEIVEDDPDTAEQELRAKVSLFPKLWTPEATSRFVSRLPPGAVQEVESHQALSLMGPGGSFDPRYWQSFAVQMALAEVQALAIKEGRAPEHAPGHDGLAPDPGSAPAPGPAVAPASAPSASPPAPVAPPEPDDGLTPLQRARQKAELDVAEAKARGDEPVAAVEESVVVPSGAAVRWVSGPDGALLFIPTDRFDPSFVRSVQGGSHDLLGRHERPDGRSFEQWVEAGGPFLTEVPFLSRLFLDNTPVHKQLFMDRSHEQGTLRILDCHLPRVSRVRAVLVPGSATAPRRILVSSSRELSGEQILTLLD